MRYFFACSIFDPGKIYCCDDDMSLYSLVEAIIRENDNVADWINISNLPSATLMIGQSFSKRCRQTGDLSMIERIIRILNPGSQHYDDNLNFIDQESNVLKVFEIEPSNEPGRLFFALSSGTSGEGFSKCTPQRTSVKSYKSFASMKYRELSSSATPLGPIYIKDGLRYETYLGGLYHTLVTLECDSPTITRLLYAKE